MQEPSIKLMLRLFIFEIIVISVSFPKNASPPNLDLDLPLTVDYARANIKV